MDFQAPPGTSLAETSRVLDEVEKIISTNADVEGYSRRLGTQLGPFITEPDRGDYLIKLKANRKHSTEEVLAGMRHDFNRAFPDDPLGFSRISGGFDRRSADGARPDSNLSVFTRSGVAGENRAARGERRSRRFPAWWIRSMA